MKIFCINRTCDTERRALISQYFGDRVEFVTAVDKDDVPCASGSMTDGEYACFLSHKKTWQQVAAIDDEFAVVIEDDVQPVGDFEGIEMGGADVLLLNRTMMRCDDYNNFLYGLGAWGYSMTRSAAVISLSEMSDIISPIDLQWYIEMFEHSQMFSSGLKRRRLLKAKVAEKDFIIPNKLAKKTTLTDDSEKHHSKNYGGDRWL